MAVQRNDPYRNFNFLVALGDGSEDTVAGGFEEVTRLRSDVDVADYRNGNDKANHVRKITGLSKVADVTLKRGVIGSLSAFQWFAQTRDGTPDVRTVTITMLDETRQSVMTFRLVGARPVRFSAGPLNAKGTDVAMEELTLAYERLEIE